MPDQTPEQRESALKLADELHSAAIDSRLNMKPICLMMDGAKAIRDLHAENVRLREALRRLADVTPDYSGEFHALNNARATLSGSPATEAAKE